MINISMAQPPIMVPQIGGADSSVATTPTTQKGAVLPLAHWLHGGGAWWWCMSTAAFVYMMSVY
jgi:hypothetical protein